MRKSIPIKSKIRLWNSLFLGFDLLCVLRNLRSLTLVIEFGLDGLELTGIFHVIGTFIVFASILFAGPLISRGKKSGLYLYIVLVPVRFYTGLFTFSAIKDLMHLSTDNTYNSPVIVFAVLGVLEAIRLMYTVRVYSHYLPKTQLSNNQLIDS